MSLEYQDWNFVDIRASLIIIPETNRFTHDFITWLQAHFDDGDKVTMQGYQESDFIRFWVEDGKRLLMMKLRWGGNG